MSLVRSVLAAAGVKPLMLPVKNPNLRAPERQPEIDLGAELARLPQGKLEKHFGCNPVTLWR